MNELNQKIGLAIEAKQDALARGIVTKQYAIQNKLWEPYGNTGHQKSLRDASYHLSYLVEAIKAADPSLFIDYVAWVKVLFKGLGFPDQVLETTLQLTRDELKRQLPEEMAAVAVKFVDVGLESFSQLSDTLPSFIVKEQPLENEAREFRDALLKGERHTASQLIQDLVKGGVSVQDIYLNIFQSSQRDIGRMWQMNQISVAQEHYCTAATQTIMSQLYPLIFATEKHGHQLVAASVSGELHELGIRMVADFFEINGWHTYYLGANTPADSIIQMIEERSADVLAISATITFHVNKVAELIASVRASEPVKDITILVGGYPFNISPDLWKSIDADGFARDAQQAVQFANQMVGLEDAV